MSNVTVEPDSGRHSVTHAGAREDICANLDRSVAIARALLVSLNPSQIPAEFVALVAGCSA